MNVLLEPSGEVKLARLAVLVLLFLVTSATLIFVAPLAMPAGYSWRMHSISESAAQAQEGAWIARLGMMSFGVGALLLAIAMRRRWARLTCWMNLAFTFFMFGAAAFSHKPWVPGIRSDDLEDFLHSVCATGMGFAFCVGVVARLAQRVRHALTGRVLDALALIVAVAMPAIMAASSTVGGLVQRVMFAVAYVWFGREALIAIGLLKEQNDA